MDWTTCIRTRFAKEAKPDKNLAKSLILSSSKKLKSQSMLQTNETTAASKVVLCYDALRELLEALAITKGYKIYNHECYCSLFKEVLSESALGDEFDKFRRIRNGINYYGKSVAPAEADAVIEKMISFITKIKLKFPELTSRAS